MRQAGFAVQVHDTSDLAPVLARYHIPPNLEACHTATVGGYVVEGHVPPDLIARMLREKPRVAGLAVPGMPPTSPGMDMPSGPPYQVLTFTPDGRTAVYATRR